MLKKYSQPNLTSSIELGCIIEKIYKAIDETFCVDCKTIKLLCSIQLFMNERIIMNLFFSIYLYLLPIITSSFIHLKSETQ